MQYDKTANEPLNEDRQGEVLLQASSEPNNTQKKLYLESYGCQMNFSDSEVVASILAQDGYATTRNIAEADLVLINTCSIRDNAEQRVRNRLTEFQHHKQQNPELVVGILGLSNIFVQVEDPVLIHTDNISDQEVRPVFIKVDAIFVHVEDPVFTQIPMLHRTKVYVAQITTNVSVDVC